MFKVHNKDSRTYFTPCSSVSIVNFKLVDVGWVKACKTWVGSASESLKKICFILILTKSLPTQMPSLVNRTESPFYQPKPWTWKWKSKMWILWNKRYWLYWYERKTLSRRKAAIGGALKKLFAKLTGKQPCQSLFIIKVTGIRSATLWKIEIPTLVFSCEFWEIFKNIFYTEHLQARTGVREKYSIANLE